MRSQEKRLINVEITRKDGNITKGKILPEEKINLEKKGFKIKELKAERLTKEQK